MKRFLSILLISLLTFNTFTLATNVDESNTTEVVQNTLAKKLKKLIDSEIFTVMFNYKKINEVVKEAMSKVSEQEKEDAAKQYPQLSFDSSNFDTEYSTYNWLATLIPIAIKEGIEKDEITQNTIDQILSIPNFMGKQVDQITIRKGMTDAEIEKIAEDLVDVLTMMFDTEFLRAMGVNLNDPDTIEELKRSFDSSGLF